MKKTVLTTALAVLGLASVTAWAAEPQNFVHGQYTFRDTIAGQSDNANRQGINLTVGRNIGYGITLDAGAQVRNENGSNGADTTRLETGATYQTEIVKHVAFYTRGALGYKLTDQEDSTYYSVEPGIRVQLLQPLSVRVGYRYRTAFNDSIFDKTNTVRIGAEYAFTPTQAVTLGIDRAYGDSEYVGVNVGYAVKF